MLHTLTIILRGLSLAACLSAFGCLVFTRLVLPPHHGDFKLQRLTQLSLLAGLLLTLGWLVIETDSIAEPESLADLLAALPVVAFDLQFGRLVLARLALLLLALLLRPAALPSTGFAVALQAVMGHAMARLATDGYALPAAEMLHVLAAGAWLGGLLPLLLSIARLPPGMGAALSRRFSPLALACVVVLAGSGALQASDLVRSLATPYGRTVQIKLALFAVLLAIACVNRFALTTRLERGQNLLIWSVVVETGLGAAVVMTAANLASQAPT